MLYYFHIDPSKLTDEEWGVRVNQMIWILEREKKLSETK